MADRRARENKPSQLRVIAKSTPDGEGGSIQNLSQGSPPLVSQQSFAERAAARKERLAVLKQEALDRVAKKRFLEKAQKRCVCVVYIYML